MLSFQCRKPFTPNRRDFLRFAAGGASAAAALTSIPMFAHRALANEATLNDPLVVAARAEKTLNTIALPPDWANYAKIIRHFEEKYGLNIKNASPDATSAQEIQAVRSLKGQSRAPDVLDLGQPFALVGAHDGLLAPYKVKTWESIPANMKDESGLWYADYFGIVSFGVNLSVVKNAPRSWADLKKPEYRGMVALNGSPLGAGAAFAGVFAAALANGGSLDDIAPGVTFFAELAANRNFTPVAASPASLTSGQTPIVINWDYLNLAQATKAHGITEVTTIIPEGATPFGNYYCQAISRYAPHPSAARLWMEFLYSDEGQLLFLEGYAHPARFADLMDRNIIPETLLTQLPPAAHYKAVRFPSIDQSARAQKALGAEWTRQVRT